MRLRQSWISSALALTLLAAPAAAGEGAAERLAEAIRFRTVSHQDPADRDDAEFRRFHGFLEARFPNAHRTLARETVNDLSLLYTWRGSDRALAPLLLTAHFDVVPVPVDGLPRWDHAPFAGVIADGFVWGRGAIDDKVGVMGMIEAVERLAAEGFQPRRTILLAFGHDEEVGGPEGAGATARLLKQRGIRPWMSLDEGLAVITGGGLGGIDVPVALIGIAEKGSTTLRVTAKSEGGHSSVPPPSTAIGKLARAITRIEESPMPAQVEGVVGDMLDALAEHQGWLARFVTTQRWLTAPLLESRLSASPTTNALARTTTAVTIVTGGLKSNVLPSEATATVNFRLLPGDTAQDVKEHVLAAIGPGYEVVIENGREASPVSSVDSDAYALLRDTVAAQFPGAAIAPGLVMAGTDTKHYVSIVEHAYRFTPMELGPGDLSRIHGVNERLSVAGFERVIDFYERLIRAAAGG